MKHLIFLCSFLLCVLIYSDLNDVQASCPHPTSQSDPNYQPHCGIWICLPGGFPSDCGEQKSAFISRVKQMIDGCSPLPRYSGCADTQGAENPYHVDAQLGSCRKVGKDEDRWNHSFCTHYGRFVNVTMKIDGQTIFRRYWW